MPVKSEGDVSDKLDGTLGIFVGTDGMFCACCSC